jgi:hypothetical protein
LKDFLQAPATQRWDDHRYWHHNRINQSLHFISAIRFIAAYGLLFVDPPSAALLAPTGLGRAHEHPPGRRGATRLATRESLPSGGCLASESSRRLPATEKAVAREARATDSLMDFSTWADPRVVRAGLHNARNATIDDFIVPTHRGHAGVIGPTEHRQT